MKKLFQLILLFAALSATAQTHVLFTLGTGYFNASPATNRVITLQVLQPFPGNLARYTSSVSGTFYLSNAPVSDIAGNILAQGNAAAIPFQITVTATNLGVIGAETITSVAGSQTYPTSGKSAWSIQASDYRYAGGTNTSVTVAQLNSSSNIVYVAGVNGTNQLGIVMTNLHVVTSNGVTVAYVASDNSLSNALRLALLTADVTTSNAVVSAYVTSDNSLSNVLRLAQIASTNDLASTLVASANSGSNVLRLAQINSTNNLVTTNDSRSLNFSGIVSGHDARFTNTTRAFEVWTFYPHAQISIPFGSDSEIFGGPVTAPLYIGDGNSLSNLDFVSLSLIGRTGVTNAAVTQIGLATNLVATWVTNSSAYQALIATQALASVINVNAASNVLRSAQIASTNDLAAVILADITITNTATRLNLTNHVNYVSNSLFSLIGSVSGVATNAWGLSGNDGTGGTNFIGTTNNFALVLKQNNQWVGVFDTEYSGQPQSVTFGQNNTNVNSPGAYIGGGASNLITGYQPFSVVSGGKSNLVSGVTNSAFSGNVGYNTIGGGSSNVIADAGGGTFNARNTIGGGHQNAIYDNGGNASTIAGGRQNISSNGTLATIGGGFGNWIGIVSGASAGGAVIAGGQNNVINPTSNENGAAIGGGFNNTNNGNYSTVPGGRANFVSGDYGFSANRSAQSLHDGATVFGDSTASAFASTIADSVAFRATGGFAIGTNNPSGQRLKVIGNVDSTTFTGQIGTLSNAVASASQNFGSNPFATVSTNLIALTGAGSTTNNGTYVLQSANNYTNANGNGNVITNIANVWYLKAGSSVTYSSATQPTNALWTQVNGALPVPASVFGAYLNLTGNMFLGQIVSSNLTDRLNQLTNTYNAAASNIVNLITAGTVTGAILNTASNAIVNGGTFYSNNFVVIHNATRTSYQTYKAAQAAAVAGDTIKAIGLIPTNNLMKANVNLDLTDADVSHYQNYTNLAGWALIDDRPAGAGGGTQWVHCANLSFFGFTNVPTDSLFDGVALNPGTEGAVIITNKNTEIHFTAKRIISSFISQNYTYGGAVTVINGNTNSTFDYDEAVDPYKDMQWLDSEFNPFQSFASAFACDLSFGAPSYVRVGNIGRQESFGIYLLENTAGNHTNNLIIHGKKWLSKVSAQTHSTNVFVTINFDTISAPGTPLSFLGSGRYEVNCDDVDAESVGHAMDTTPNGAFSNLNVTITAKRFKSNTDWADVYCGDVVLNVQRYEDGGGMLKGFNQYTGGRLTINGGVASGHGVGYGVNSTATNFVTVNSLSLTNFGTNYFIGAGGTVRVSGGWNSTAGTAGKGIVIVGAGADARFQNVTFDTSGVNNANNNPVFAVATGLQLKGCTLIAPALADSLTAPTAINIGVYWSAATTAKNANVTLSPNAGLTVDSTVK